MITNILAAYDGRLWSKITEDPKSDCWLWTGAMTGGSPISYGNFWLGSGLRRVAKSHRVVYELFAGPIPAGLHLDHLCRVPRCCNPDHLEPVTQAENNRRGEKGVLRPATSHCPAGHQRTSVTTYTSPKGFIGCRPCRAEASKRHRERVKHERT